MRNLKPKDKLIVIDDHPNWTEPPPFKNGDIVEFVEYSRDSTVFITIKIFKELWKGWHISRFEKINGYRKEYR